MDLAVVILIAVGVGIVLGAFGMHHIHNVANAAARAVTVPAGSVASTPAAVNAVSADLVSRIAAIEAKFSTAAPKA
jgi:hypothetical protein